MGQWRGDILVVTTTGFNERAWLDFFGHPRSEAMRITERYRRRDVGHMDVEMTFDDPKYYTRPFGLKTTLTLVPDSDVLEFEASAGQSVNGERHEGQRAVRTADEAVFAQYPDAHWANARHFVKGNRGVSEWTFTGTLNDGRVEVTGCDVFTFRNDKIAVKNSFRKNRPSMV